ncbi:GDP-mannose 4,6-dehydratase [Synechococcus sp. W4D4]|uniref:GDP-mannose 4,6-dehydratase n=1 Tax=Synechococcus sp. W4D4 TaxID=3392294 RepID=UPI0039ED3185
MNIVIGARGQDGSFVYDQLSSHKLPVIGLGRDGVSKSANISDDVIEVIRSLQQSLKSWDHNEKMFSEFLLRVNAGVIFDCAASHTSTKKFSRSNQQEMYQLNVRRTSCIQDSLMRSADKGLTPRLITCGSSLMYDGKGGLRVDEETRMSPTTGYGYAKMIARNQCSVLRHFGLEASMAILFNHDSVRRSQEYFLPRAIKAVSDYSEETPVESFGCLERQIDIGSAKDVACALVRLSKVERLSSDYVVATGRLTTLAEMVDYIGQHFGLTGVSRVLGDEGPCENIRKDFLIGDISKVTREVGWEPTEDIFDVIDSMVQRYRDER